MIRPIFASIVAVAVTWAFAGCVADSGESVEDASWAVKASDAEIAANCSLNNPKKEAVCHIPPGNPANAHTICISKSAVQKHLDLHGDYLGACQGNSGTGGSGTTGQGGSSNSGGNSGSGAGTPTGTGGGSTTTDECFGAQPCTMDSQCPVDHTCQSGCCISLLN